MNAASVPVGFLMIPQEEYNALLKDRERLEHLLDLCYLPDDHPTGLPQIFMCASPAAVPLGMITLNTAKDRVTLRAAIDKAMEAKK